MSRVLVEDEQFPHLGGNIIGGDPWTWEPELWAWLRKRFSVRSVLDVGCGGGFSTKWWRKRGILAIGLDGLPLNVMLTGSPAILCDLTKPVPPFPPVDLVWCCEVVEHVAEEFLDNLLSALCAGRFLAMTHAVPRQGGHHHVNCRPEEYWVSVLERAGYRRMAETTHARSLCEEEHHFRKHGLLFERERMK